MRYCKVGRFPSRLVVPTLVLHDVFKTCLDYSSQLELPTSPSISKLSEGLPFAAEAMCTPISTTTVKCGDGRSETLYQSSQGMVGSPFAIANEIPISSGVLSLRGKIPNTNYQIPNTLLDSLAVLSLVSQRGKIPNTKYQIPNRGFVLHWQVPLTNNF